MWKRIEPPPVEESEATRVKAVLNETIKAWANAIATMHKSSLEAGKAVIDAGEVSIGGESGGEGVFRPHVDEGRSRQ